MDDRPDSGDPRTWDPEATQYLPPTATPHPWPGPDAPGYEAPGYEVPGYGVPGPGTPEYDVPEYGAPGHHDAPPYEAPPYDVPGYGAPSYDPSDATQLLPPTPAYDASASDATQVLRPTPAHDVSGSDATRLLPPVPTHGGPVPPVGPGGYGPPPAESTRPLPRVVDGRPPRTAPRGAPGGARRRGPSRTVLVGAAIAACAVLGLGIGALLGGGEGDPAPVAAGTATAGSGAATAPPATPGPPPTPSPSATESRPPVPTGRFVLFDAATGRAADVSAAATTDGAPVIAWERHAQANQQWLVEDLGDGHVQIKAGHSGLCLQPTEPVGAGAAVVQRPCVAGDAQRWLPAASADATTHGFTLKGSGLALAPAGPENGAPLSLQAADPAAPPVWTLQPVG